MKYTPDELYNKVMTLRKEMDNETDPFVKNLRRKIVLEFFDNNEEQFVSIKKSLNK